jgi:Reverse transcriptase (RNA-dependent DNA polymerase)
MIDSVIQHYEETARLEDKTIIQFYADDGFISAVDETVAQYTLNILQQDFKRFGLEINVNKIESMTMVGCQAVH